MSFRLNADKPANLIALICKWLFVYLVWLQTKSGELFFYPKLMKYLLTALMI